MSAKIPDEMHKLKGTRPTRAAKPKNDQFRGGRPRMPKWYNELEKEIWRGIVRLLRGRGVLTAAEGPLIEIYVATKIHHLECMDEIKEHGVMIEETVTDSNGQAHTKRVLNPAAKNATSVVGQLRAQLKELCATVASREKATRVVPIKPKKQSEKTVAEIEEESFAALLENK